MATRERTTSSRLTGRSPALELVGGALGRSVSAICYSGVPPLSDFLVHLGHPAARCDQTTRTDSSAKGLLENDAEYRPAAAKPPEYLLTRLRDEPSGRFSIPWGRMGCDQQVPPRARSAARPLRHDEVRH